MEIISRKYNIHYRDFVGSLIYPLSTRIDFCFSVHKLEFFSSNTGKVHFEIILHLLKYIRDNNNLGLKHYDIKEDAPISDLLRQVSIKSENQFMVLSNSRRKYCTDTVRIAGLCLVFYQVVLINHCTHVPVPVS